MSWWKVLRTKVPREREKLPASHTQNKKREAAELPRLSPKTLVET